MARIPAVLLALATLVVALPAQQAAGTARAWDHESSDIPVDARIHFGTLPNGMRYAWANNPEPQKRVYLRLHVDAGSYAELDSEQGMAHFLEHMAFNGSENFAPGTLIEWFQEHGMSFGADTNAHTAFSETVYKLDLPENDDATLREGLLVLRDFAFGMTIAEDEVQAEKGVIDGEERERDSAGFRAMRHQLERAYAGTRLPERLPIGTKEVRDAFTAESVRAFYERWYRPELMTLVIVGDLGALDPGALVEEFFAEVAAPASAVPDEPALGTPAMDDLVFAIYDEELPQVNLSIERLRPWVDRPDTVAQRREDLQRRVAHAIVNLRFSEMMKDPETPFLGAGSSDAGGMQVFEGGSLSVTADPAKWREAMAAAYLEMRRALNFGFLQAELDEVRADMLRGLDEAVEREATAHSAGLRESILSAVENGGVPTDAATRREILRPALEAMTVEDCLEALRGAWRGGELAVTAVGGLDLGENAAATLLAAFEEARTAEVTPPAEIAAAEFAYASDPAQGGEVVSQEFVGDGLDFWQVHFANGVALNVKSTDFKEREVLVQARLGEGALAVPDEQLVAAALGAGFLTAGGLEAHDADALRRLTAGRQVGVGMALEDDHLALAGGTAPDDLLLQFELMCAFMQHPGWRPDGLVQFSAQVPLIFQMLPRQPAGPLMMDFLPQLLSGNLRVGVAGMTILPGQEELAALTMEDVRAALEPRFGDAPLEVTVVGDVDVNEVVALAARTFGALPTRRALQEPDAAVVNPTPPVPGLRMERRIDTADEKATVMVFFPAGDGFDRARRRNLNFLGEVVADRMRVVVREKLGASYSPGATAESSQVFHGIGVVVMQAAGDPAGADTLVDACMEVARDLAENGVSAEEVTRLAEPLLKQLRDAKRTNGYWLGGLSSAQRKPQTLADLRSVETFYAALDPAAVSALASEYLRPEKASVLVVLPLSFDADAETEEEVVEEESVEEVPVVEEPALRR